MCRAILDTYQPAEYETRKENCNFTLEKLEDERQPSKDFSEGYTLFNNESKLILLHTISDIPLINLERQKNGWHY